jgi:hypothetical protein
MNRPSSPRIVEEGVTEGGSLDKSAREKGPTAGTNAMRSVISSSLELSSIVMMFVGLSLPSFCFPCDTGASIRLFLNRLSFFFQNLFLSSSSLDVSLMESSDIPVLFIPPEDTIRRKEDVCPLQLSMDSFEIYYENYSKDTANRYRSIKKIGQGAFGDVWLGINRANGKKIALKQVRLGGGRNNGIPKAVFREIESLRNLKHANILTLYDVFPQDTHLMLVFEYMPTDLQVEINQTNHTFSLDTIQYYSYNILKGLAFCHDNHIIHRDLKPSNILIAPDGVVKLGDFGLARVYDPNSLDSMSHQVATRWYRPPELLFASRNYTPSVDIWSAGAIIAELMTLSPLFPGNNDIDQISKVFEVMGTPTKNSWPVSDLLHLFLVISSRHRNSMISLTLEKLSFQIWLLSPFISSSHKWIEMLLNFF